MPRKKNRRKEIQAKRRAAVGWKPHPKKPARQAITIAHHTDMDAHGVSIAALVGLIARRFDMHRDPELDRIIDDNLDDLYES